MKLLIRNCLQGWRSFNVWVTDDANRLPLMIDSPLSVGSVKAVLYKHKGLRWPEKAKV